MNKISIGSHGWTDMSKYEDSLYAAHWHEKKGRIKEAVDALNKAEKQTSDHEELVHLRLWRGRLQKQIEEVTKQA